MDPRAFGPGGSTTATEESVIDLIQSRGHGEGGGLLTSEDGQTAALPTCLLVQGTQSVRADGWLMVPPGRPGFPEGS